MLDRVDIADRATKVLLGGFIESVKSLGEFADASPENKEKEFRQKYMLDCWYTIILKFQPNNQPRYFTLRNHLASIFYNYFQEIYWGIWDPLRHYQQAREGGRLREAAKQQ